MHALSTAGHLIITDKQVLEKFNASVRAMNSRGEEFRTASRDFATLQKSTLQKFGVTSKETGVR